METRFIWPFSQSISIPSLFHVWSVKYFRHLVLHFQSQTFVSNMYLLKHQNTKRAIRTSVTLPPLQLAPVIHYFVSVVVMANKTALICIDWYTAQAQESTYMPLFFVISFVSLWDPWEFWSAYLVTMYPIASNKIFCLNDDIISVPTI